MVANILVAGFIGTFLVIVLFGHVLLLRDWWSRMRRPHGAVDTTVPSAMRIPAE